MSDPTSLTAPQRKKAQNAALLAQLFATLIIMTVSGQYMILYANDVVGLTPQQIAVIFSLAPFLSVLRLPAIPTIQKIGLVRTLQLSRFFQGVIILLLILIPATTLNLPTLSLLVGLFILFRELGLGTVWQPLLRTITTEEDRGDFFARMRTCFSLVNLSLSAAVALFIGQDLEEYQYKIILGLAIFGSVNAIFWSRYIPEPPRIRNPVRSSFIKASKSLWKLCRQSPLFRVPLLATLVISMAQLPIGLVYFREALNVPANLLAIMIFTATLGQVLSLIFWGRTSDTLGFRPTMAGLLWLTSGISLILWFIPVFPEAPSTTLELFHDYPLGVTALLVFGFGNGVLIAGLGIATTSVVHYHVNSRNSMLAMNLYTLIQLAFQAILMIVIGALLENHVIPLKGEADPLALIQFDYFKLFRSGLVPFLMLVTIPFVLKLPNLKPWFGVTDFFSIFRYNPVRSLMGSRFLYDEDETHRVDLARSLGDSPSPLNLNLLGELLRDPSFEVKQEAIRSLSRSRSTYAGTILLDILKDTQRRGLWDLAAWALGEIHYTEAVPALIDCLQPELPGRIRSSAARALGKIGDLRAVDPILNAMHQEREQLYVIASYAWALLFLDADKRADIAFECILRLRDREERYELLSILSRWLHITDRWLLISDSETTAARSLEIYLSGFSEKWLRRHQRIIGLFQARDFQGINRLLRKKIHAMGSDSRETALEGLLHVLETKADNWSPLSVLATAWLLFNSN